MTTDKPTPRPAVSHRVGDAVPTKGAVTLPDGTDLQVIRGTFILDRPGTFVVDGEPVTAR